MSEKEDKQQFTDILFLLISIQSFVSFELIPNVGQFLVYSLDFSFFTLT